MKYPAITTLILGSYVILFLNFSTKFIKKVFLSELESSYFVTVDLLKNNIHVWLHAFATLVYLTESDILFIGRVLLCIYF